MDIILREIFKHIYTEGSKSKTAFDLSKDLFGHYDEDNFMDLFDDIFKEYSDYLEADPESTPVIVPNNDTFSLRFGVCRVNDLTDPLGIFGVRMVFDFAKNDTVKVEYTITSFSSGHNESVSYQNAKNNVKRFKLKK